MERLQKRRNYFLIMYSTLALLLFSIYILISLISINYAGAISAFLVMSMSLYGNYQVNKFYTSKILCFYQMNKIESILQSVDYTFNLKGELLVAKQKNILKRIFNLDANTIYIDPISKEIVARNAEIKMIKTALKKGPAIIA